MTKILLIDDDDSFRRLLSIRLRSIVGAEAGIDQVNSLAGARELIERHGSMNWELIFLDQHLRDGRGVDFLATHPFAGQLVLVLSSDTAPELAGEAVKVGAGYFLNKAQVSEPLFRPLIQGLLERAKLVREVAELRRLKIERETIGTLIATLKHEINNPLGVVLGANFLVQQSTTLSEQQQKAVEMIEQSGQRIREVIQKLDQTDNVIQTVKSGVAVYKVPGDADW